MADENAPDPNTVSAPVSTKAAVDKVKDDLHQTATDTVAAAETAKKQVENAGHHKLKHLEDKWMEEWRKLFTGMEGSAKTLLEELASWL
jgi:hypothetical protein